MAAPEHPAGCVGAWCSAALTALPPTAAPKIHTCAWQTGMWLMVVWVCGYPCSAPRASALVAPPALWASLSTSRSDHQLSGLHIPMTLGMGLALVGWLAPHSLHGALACGSSRSPGPLFTRAGEESGCRGSGREMLVPLTPASRPCEHS